jgi:uncharacterized lipoprotein YajG
MRVLTLASSFTIATALLAGCSTPPKVAEKPAEAPATPVVQDNRAVATVTAPVIDPLNDPKISCPSAAFILILMRMW